MVSMRFDVRVEVGEVEEVVGFNEASLGHLAPPRKSTQMPSLLT